MPRNRAFRGVFALAVIAALLAASLPAAAQDQPTTAYQMNMREGAGTGFRVLATLPGGTPVELEARSASNEWVLGHTLDGAARGWLAAIYLRFPPGYNAFALPVSDERVVGGAAPAAPAAPPPAEQPAPAPGGEVSASTVQALNVRGGPGLNQPIIGRAAGGTAFVLEGRSDDGTWVLGHTADNALRGWLYAPYLRFTAGSAEGLPPSGEILGGPLTDASGSAATTRIAPFNLARVQGINLSAYPVVGRSTGRARAIFLDGRRRGNQANVVSKVGDCSSEHWYFLSPFGWGQYDLGGYGSLQGVVDHFGASLGNDSEATHNGFNANAVIAPEWANPAICQKGESPLTCEYRLHKPAVAVIMFGTSDLLVMAPNEFDHYLRRMVNDSINAGVIPILSTFPGNQGFWDKTILYNQIVVRIALDYDIPLINLWLALEALPNHGLEPDGFHLGEPPNGVAGVLTEPYLSTGYPMRNLVTLQTLDAVWRGAMR